MSGISELTIDELSIVSSGYKGCVNGPAGTGMYPDYVVCDGKSSFWQAVSNAAVDALRPK